MTSGRDAIIQLLGFIGSPQDTFRVFHVTGSNGKWSTCQMISQVLYKEFGEKVWLFTSPHLIDITERFQINGQPISYARLNRYYKKVFWLTKKYKITLSFFEIQVVAMVLYFSDENVDYVVVEVWLGWLYDGTNIFKKPLACFITSIALEHTYLLWKTRQSILKNKLWIVKKDTLLYTWIRNQQVQNYCKNIWAKIWILKPSTNQLTNLPWKHQQKNALLVLQALTDLWFEEQRVLQGLHNIHNPGRYEWIMPHIFVDTANNRENIYLLKKMLQKQDVWEVTFIFGTTQPEISYIQSIIHMFLGQNMIFVDGFCERALPCSKYLKNIKQGTTVWHLDKWEGIKNIQSLLNNRKTPKKYIIFWSLYLVWYIMKLSRHNIFANT